MILHIDMLWREIFNMTIREVKLSSHLYICTAHRSPLPPDSGIVVPQDWIGHP